MKKLAIVLFCLALVFAFSTQVVAKNDKSDCTTIQDGTLETTDGRVITTGYDEWGYNYQAHMFNGFYCDAYRDAAWCQDYKEDELMMKWNDAWLSNKDCDGDGLLDRHCGFDTYIGSGAWLTNHQWGSYLGNWDLTGDWVLKFDYLGTSYIHDMALVDNTFTGTGGYPAAGPPYSITWTVKGIIDGDNIEMRIEYDGSSYYVDVVGTIAQDGTMSGTWDNPSQEGVWESTSGAGTGETCKWNYFVKIVAPPADAELIEGFWYTADETEIGPVIWGYFAIIMEVENDSCAGLHGAQYVSPVGPGFGKFKPYELE